MLSPIPDSLAFIGGFVLFFHQFFHWTTPSPYFNNPPVDCNWYLYNKTASNAIVNAASNISYRPLIQANVVIGKQYVHKQNCSHDFYFNFINYHIIIVQDRFITIETKEFAVLHRTGFFFRMSTQVKAEVRTTKAFTWVRMWKKKPVIFNTGRFFYFNSYVSYTHFLWQLLPHYQYHSSLSSTFLHRLVFLVVLLCRFVTFLQLYCCFCNILSNFIT